jgi:hypothetical protein
MPRYNPTITLTREEHNRMVYATIDCEEPKCGAVRGEVCISLIKDHAPTATPHHWRALYFTTWKKRNPRSFQRLLNQVLAQRPVTPMPPIKEFLESL